jgi:uncharacterized RDD family membrane protein YckC
MDLGDSKTVYTPEHVAVTYQLAGVGTRFAAMVIDTFAQWLLAMLAVLVLVLVGVGTELGTTWTGWRVWSEWWMVALLLLVLFTCYWGYFLFWEVIWNGQTPGKRVCGLRVMRDGGFPLDFRAAFLRNIVRGIDAQPGLMYGVGVLTMFLSKESKRLGDYAAGTIVVVDPRRAAARPAPPPPPSAATEAAPEAPPPPPAPDYQVIGDPALLSLRAVTREQFSVVERFLARRAALPEKVRADLAQQIATPLATLIGFALPEDGFPYERFLVEVAIAYRHRPGV